MQHTKIENVDTKITNAYQIDAKEWARNLLPFASAKNGRGAIEIAITFLPFCVFWYAAWYTMNAGYIAGWLFTLPASAFLLRLFLIQHDCGHGSFFSSRRTNDWTGRLIGILTFTPYAFWRHTHNLHHAGSGNLERRGFGDIDTMTVKEFNESSTWQRLKYRLYRNPFIMFGLGPVYTFVIDQRLPWGQMNKGAQPWLSTMGTNLTIALVCTGIIYFAGWQLFALIQLSVVVIAGTIGIWLFFVQHQFEDMEWDHDEEWNRHHSALHGSSHYDIPQPLRWFTANIGLHHIHHLSARIPYYQLSKAVKAYPALKDVNRLTVRESFKSVPLTLWDETRRSMVSFKAAGF